MSFGIDFGTSICTMCASDPESGKIEILRDGDGLVEIPSVVYWTADGRHKVGLAAVEQLTDAGGDELYELQCRTIKSIKRNFTSDAPISMPDGELVYPVDVVAEILKYLKRNAEERKFHHQELTEVCLTHPVSFTLSQKNLLTEAARKAGFLRIKLIEEPIAAAMGFVADNNRVGNGIVVYDLGAGTLDLAYVRREADGTFRVPVPPLGDARCGGDDFDRLIYDYLEKKAGESFSPNTSAFNLPTLYGCRHLKESLSRRDNATLSVYGKPRLQLSRAEFEKLIENKVGNSIRLLQRLLAEVASAGYQVDTAILIGGSSRIPRIQSMVEDALPVKPLVTMDDNVAVAKGAVATSLRESTAHFRKEPQKQDDFSRLTEAAQTGDPGAMYELGEIYYERGDKRNALKMWIFAASAGHKKAIEKVRKFDVVPSQPVDAAIPPQTEKQPEVTDAYIEEIVDAGVSFYYAYGKSQNYTEAVALFSEAANYGNARAQYMLGLCYYNGHGVKQNQDRAVQLFLEAAKQRDASAQYMLGSCYYNGNGIGSVNLQKAAFWLRRAAANNQNEAKELLEQIEKSNRESVNPVSSDQTTPVPEPTVSSSASQYDADYWFKMIVSIIVVGIGVGLAFTGIGIPISVLCFVALKQVWGWK